MLHSPLGWQDLCLDSQSQQTQAGEEFQTHQTSQPEERLLLITAENWAETFGILRNLISFEKMEFIRTMNIEWALSDSIEFMIETYSNMFEKYDYGFVAQRSLISSYKSNIINLMKSQQ